MDHQRIRLTKTNSRQQQILYRWGGWLKYLWWEKYYLMSKIFIKSHLPCLYASLVHILWTLLMLSPTARLKSDLCNKQNEIYFPTFSFIVELLWSTIYVATHPHLICCETVTGVFLDASHKLWPRFRKEDTKKFYINTYIFLHIFPQHSLADMVHILIGGREDISGILE